MKSKFRLLKKLLPKKFQTRRMGYFGTVLLVLFSLLSYDIFLTPSTATAATISTSSSSAASGNPSQHHVQVASNGTIVSFFNAGTVGATGIVYSKSVDGGTTWSAAVTVDTTQTNDFATAIDSADNIYVVYGNGATPGAIFLRKLTYSSGSWSIGNASTIQSGSTCSTSGKGTNGNSYMSPTIAILPNSNIFVAAADIYNGFSSADGLCSSPSDKEADFYSASGTSWTAGTVYAGRASTTSPMPLLAVGNSALLFFNDGSLLVKPSLTGSWSAVAKVAASGSASDMSYSLDKLMLVYTKSASGIYASEFSISSNTLSSETTISTTSDTIGSLTSDSVNTWLIYTSVSSGSPNINFKKYNGSIWSAATTVTTDNTSSYASAPQRITNSVFTVPFIWTAGSSSPYTIYSSSINDMGAATDTGNISGTYSGSLTGTSGDVIVKCGVWYYGTVNIVAGMTIKVCPYDGQGGGGLTLYANTVTIAGTIDGSGRGNPIAVGPAGIGGKGSTTAGVAGTSNVGSQGAGSFSGLAGAAGTNAAGGAAAGANATGISAGGGGGSGGSGSSETAGGAGTNGGYSTNAANGDATTDESLAMGSSGGSGGSGGSGAGGGGGGGGFGGVCPGAGGSGGNGAPGGIGGSGGDGGAIIKIYSNGSVNLTGSIVSVGMAGGTIGGGQTGTSGTTGFTGNGAPIC